MSELHHLLTLPTRPITEEYVTKLRHFLESGIPATYTLEQAAEYERELQSGPVQNKTDSASASDSEQANSNTTPLHILARSLPTDLSPEELQVVLTLMNTLFEYGAGWNFVDYENKTVGDLLLEKGQPRDGVLYSRLVEAGVSAELLLRKVNGAEVEFLDMGAEDLQDNYTNTGAPVEQSEELASHTDGSNTNRNDSGHSADAAGDQNTFLKTKLEYHDGTLTTKDAKDGVMMDWETDIMKLAAKTILSSSSPSEAVVLNIGFGMGIIDTFIQEAHPLKHYICEAHPDVLAKMKADGWYDKPNVVVLEGRWQDSLNKLLDKGDVFFDGVYYDTFSEHYEDMLDLYDVIVGLLKPEGIFSFFNGLGADRPLCYDVYKRIVELDLAQYGLKCEFTILNIGKSLPDWKEVNRSYFNCDYYYHPSIHFA